ncbi:MAG: DUF1573 domain-containing protein [Bacteroidaceae bacterium]|nr:DUF1573 domain-containing protein [Bacteroidaceae bacterium]MBQ8889494.1 DUF1573 domain-containing protein [Bacteroidaceae bacterium]
MKKILLTSIFMIIGLVAFAAQDGGADIKFDKTTHNFGTFSEDNPKVTCTFKFTNTGDKLLVIHQAIASCGCTVPLYPKEPIKPGEGGEITVTYDGSGKFPGHFKKSITLRTNAKKEIIRLYVEGDMTPKTK